MAVFFDEAHKLCNEETGVTRASMALKARFLLPMTGTPFRNEYSDCGTMMRLLGVAPWDNAKAFKVVSWSVKHNLFLTNVCSASFYL
jgi:hypothetical protein